MAAPITPLPPGDQSPEGYLQMSQRFIEQSRLHLEEGDRVQASEKVSSAVAAALKSVAQQRGWRHRSHALRDAIVTQLGAELGRSTPVAQSLFLGRKAAADHHRNHYDNTLDEVDIWDDIPIAESVVDAVKLIMTEPPKPFTVVRPLDAHRISQLTGHEPAVGATDARGFANFTGVVRAE